MTNLQVYKPFRDLFNLSNDLDRMFWGTKKLEEEDVSSNWTPNVDIFEDEESIHIDAELPGLKREDVKINVRDNVLTIRGERKFHEEKKKDNYYRIESSFGVFARSFTLPNTVDGENVKASMKDGVLKIQLIKREETKPKEIEIQ